MSLRRQIAVLAVLLGLATAFGTEPVRAESGFLGLQVQGMAPRAAAALGYSGPHGIMVRDVAVGGPAATAGFKHGDLIVRFDGTETQKFEDLIAAIGKTSPDQRVEIVIVRDGRRKSVTMRLGKRPEAWNVQRGGFGSHGDIGLTVAAITKPIRDRFKYRWGLNGLAVMQVNPEKPAAEVLKVGDVITHVNLRQVWDPKQFAEAIDTAKMEKRRDLLLLVANQDGFRYIVLTVNPGENL